MSYTDYGLTEGLIMLLFPISLVTLLYVYKIRKKPAPYVRAYTLLYGLILLTMALDTVWWAFDIQTGVIDQLVTRGGATEQATAFAYIMYGFIAYMILLKEPTNTEK